MWCVSSLTAIIQYQNFEFHRQFFTPSKQTTVWHSLHEVESASAATAERIDKATQESALALERLFSMVTRGTQDTGIIRDICRFFFSKENISEVEVLTNTRFVLVWTAMVSPLCQTCNSHPRHCI